MTTPKRLLEDPNEADYETLTYAAAVLEKQKGWVRFDKPLEQSLMRDAALVVLDGGTITAMGLGKLLWYIADVLENIDNLTD